MKRKLTNRQVTWLGVFIGLLITGGIVGLWSAVRHINNEEMKEKQEKDSIRISQKERIAEEVAAEQALQDSIEAYQNTHSPQVIARRMQVILSEEMRHEGKRPYFDKYRTESFKEAWHEADDFDKEPREEKPGMHFYDMPFYQLIPAKMIRDLEISRVYYVTNDRARADVNYLVKRTIKLEDEERDSVYYEHKTAIYKLVYQDNDWFVDDRMIDYQSERDCFKRYMEGVYFIDPIIEEQTDSLNIDSILLKSGIYTPVEEKVKKNESPAPKEKKGDSQQKTEEKQKADVKKQDNKQKTDSKKQDNKQKTDAKKQDNKQKTDSKKQDNKQKTDSKKQDNKQKTDAKKQDNKQKTDAKKQDNKQKTDSKKQDNKQKTDSKSNSTKTSKK